ncbi:hypothetical protein BJX61DRAFT_311938 [Aspergillus egyptiacus]|nr:hypothetical protein BJX61DRAFT_311938 [Aspergillus egyptiacus]
MDSQGFSFPPPPPPPPTQQHQSQQQYSHNAGFTPYGQNHHGQRGGRGGGGGQYRGRGRGYGNRGGGGGGGGRGGHFMSSDANRPGGYPTATGYGTMNYLGYPTPPIPSQQAGISAPHYAQSPARSFQNPVNGSSYASPTNYAQTSVHGMPYQQQPGYGTTYTNHFTQQPTAYTNGAAAHQYGTPSVQSAMMGPPLHLGFENRGQPGSFGGPQRPNLRGGRQHQGGPATHASKRDHSSAFGKPQSVAPRVPAPPPVPSFGNPLPSKPPASTDPPRKPKKKKRKHNQLGLTPKTEEHESSEEEDDADEETRLATGGTGATGLQVTYKGRTSTLQTSAEIAAWIEERKKRFPTQAKIEEKKKVLEEAKKAREDALKKQREARKQAPARSRKDQDKRDQKEQPRESLNPADAAAKAKQKAEKLRRKLMKEEKRIAQAEADAERARKLEGSQQGLTDANAGPTSTAQELDDTQGRDMLSKQTESERSRAITGLENGIQSLGPEDAEPLLHDDLAVSDSASSSAGSSDWTSSSGSDLSSSDSDESDDDSGPEEASSRRNGPERVPPPPREAKKRVCNQFARTGRCPRGRRCKYLHEKSERVAKAKDGEKQGRKGLLQALLDRQREEENRKVMETIIWLGENGLLGEPASQANAGVDPTSSNKAGET